MELMRRRFWSPSKNAKCIGSFLTFLVLAALLMLIWIPACVGLENLHGFILRLVKKS